MNKNLQYIITLACVVIAGSVIYYLFSYLPEKNKNELQLSLQKECSDLGSKRYKEDHKDGESLGNGGIFSSDYIFNKSNNSCLYKSTYAYPDGMMTQYIIDLFTNKTLGYYSVDKNGDLVDGDKGEFLYVERTNF